MPIQRLTVVDNRTRRQKRMDTLNRVLFRVCKTGVTSRIDIADRMEAILGYGVSIAWVDALLLYSRKEAERLRWQPAIAPTSTNPTGDRRFIPVLLDRDGTQHSDAEGEAIDAGTLNMLKACVSHSAHLKTQLNGASGRTPGRNRPKMLRALAHTLQFVEDKLEEMVEEFNGAA